jgi:uncharacterized protein YndB with AHSA1/START domain
MLQLTREAEIPGRPATIWSVLTDFASYPSWQKLIQIKGKAGPQERIEYSLDATGRGRTFWLEGRITR